MARLGFQEVMAIAACQAALTGKIEAVQLDVGLVRQDLDKLHLRMSEVERADWSDRGHCPGTYCIPSHTPDEGPGLGVQGGRSRKPEQEKQSLDCWTAGGSGGEEPHGLCGGPAEGPIAGGSVLAIFYGAACSSHPPGSPDHLEPARVLLFSACLTSGTGTKYFGLHVRREI